MSAMTCGTGHSEPPRCAGPWHPDATRPPAAASDQGPELLEFERVYPATSRCLCRRFILSLMLPPVRCVLILARCVLILASSSSI